MEKNSKPFCFISSTRRSRILAVGAGNDDGQPFLSDHISIRNKLTGAVIQTLNRLCSFHKIAFTDYQKKLLSQTKIMLFEYWCDSFVCLRLSPPTKRRQRCSNLSGASLVCLAAVPFPYRDHYRNHLPLFATNGRNHSTLLQPPSHVCIKLLLDILLTLNVTFLVPLTNKALF